MAFENQPGLDVLAEIPDQDFADIMESIRGGAKTAGDVFGFGTEALNTIERTAQAYYRTHQFAKAAVIYAFVLNMNPSRTSAWRGLGACGQALRDFGNAGTCYRKALELDPKDVPSSVFLAECMCQVGLRKEGVELLQKVIAEGTEIARFKPYITRARAIVAEDGGIPNTVILRKHGEALFSEASEQMLEDEAVALGISDEDMDRDIEIEDIRKNPRLFKSIQELAQLVEEEKLTYAQVGGFTDNELDGAYAVACKYAEMGEVGKSIQIAGYLIFLDPHKGRYYQLVGICLQRLKQYEGADFYYRMADIFDKNDPMTLVYRGESMIMAGKVDEGLGYVRQGREYATQDPAAQPMVDRADILLKQFGG
ncbi:MAG: hypothetical protein AAFX94_15685 [Myxococcota bacterium]